MNQVRSILYNEPFQFYFLDTRLCFEGEPVYQDDEFSHLEFENNLYVQLGFFNEKSV
jgi:hypothetical protein